MITKKQQQTKQFVTFKNIFLTLLDILLNLVKKPSQYLKGTLQFIYYIAFVISIYKCQKAQVLKHIFFSVYIMVSVMCVLPYFHHELNISTLLFSLNTLIVISNPVTYHTYYDCCSKHSEVYARSSIAGTAPLLDNGSKYGRV